MNKKKLIFLLKLLGVFFINWFAIEQGYGYNYFRYYLDVELRYHPIYETISYKGVHEISRKEALKQRHSRFKFNFQKQLVEIQFRDQKKLLDSLTEPPIIKFRYNSSNNLRTIAYYDGSKRSIARALNTSTSIIWYNYDQDNRLISIINYDKDNQLTEDWQGITSIRFRYYKGFQLKKKEYFNSKKKRVSNWKGIHCVKYSYNRQNKITLEEYYNEKLQKIDVATHYHKIGYLWCKSGRMVEKKYFDRNGRKSSGIFKISYGYSNTGALVEESFYDKDNRLINDYRGYAIVRYNRNKKMEIVETVSRTKMGGLKILRYYPSGLKSKETIINPLLKNIRRDQIPAIIQWKYDSDNRIIEKAFYSNWGILTEKNGIAKLKWQYNSKGEKTLFACYNKNNEEIVSVYYFYNLRKQLIQIAIGSTIQKNCFSNDFEKLILKKAPSTPNEIEKMILEKMAKTLYLSTNSITYYQTIKTNVSKK